MRPLSLVTLNIEGSRHLGEVAHFLAHADADVVCLQEVIQTDISRLLEALGHVEYVYAPGTIMRFSGMDGIQGPAIFSRYPLERNSVKYYIGNGRDLSEYDKSSFEAKNRSTHCAVASAVVSLDGVEYQIATTHFPVSADGEADDFQRLHVSTMIEVAKGLGEFVLTGDFNAPRGREIFARIASVFKDNIPDHVSVSLDPLLHRAGALPYMVDGIFSTSGYRVTDVEQHFGLSDHTAFSATVFRT